jgi:hypothetical protein
MKLQEGKVIIENLKQYKYSPLSIDQIKSRFQFIDEEDNND